MAEPSGPWGPHQEPDPSTPPGGAEVPGTPAPGPWERTARSPAPQEPERPRPLPGVPLKNTDFLAAQRENKRNTVLLVLILLVLGAILGYLVGAVLDILTNPPPAGEEWEAALHSRGGATGAAILVGIGLLAAIVTFNFGGRVMLSLTGAHFVTPEEEPVLHNVVEEMAIAAGMPKPRVAVMETPALNAFATGMRPQEATIAVTRGLLQSLSRDELQGVVGHEMGHVANWDIRYATAVGIMVGLIALVSDVILRSLRWGTFGRSRSSGERSGGSGGGIVALVLIVLLIFFAILAPIASKLVQLAISRQREYLADATSVRLTRDPQGLISALTKLGNSQVPMENANRATQHLFIVNPLKEFSPDASALFATHPALSQRIERLRNLGGVGVNASAS